MYVDKQILTGVQWSGADFIHLYGLFRSTGFWTGFNYSQVYLN